MILGFATGDAFAQRSGGKAKRGEAESVTLTANDGFPIHISYYKSEVGQEAPVVVCVHDKGGNRRVYDDLAKTLQAEGYAVVTVDLRKHGESKAEVPGIGAADATELRKDDYLRMVTADLDAAKDFIYKEHQAKNLNMRKMAIISAGMSVPVVTSFAVLDWQKRPYPDAPTLAQRTPRGQDVRAIVMLSPDETVPGLNANQPLLYLRNPGFEIAFLTCYGTGDKGAGKTAKDLHQKVAGLPQNKGRVYLKSYKYKQHGTDLLDKRLGVRDHVRAFLELHLKKLAGAADGWRNRESRLTREID